MDLGKVGVWWSGSWESVDPPADVAAELEAVGYGTLWSSGGFGPGLSTHFERLLASTRHAIVASGIVNIWTAAPEDLASAVAELDATYSDRFLLGLGASHAPLIENYSHPYRRTVEYLDALDSLGEPVCRDRRVLAALGPRMLQLAATRATGAHPYFVPVEHTERARRILGPGPLLAPEVTAILEPDREKARQQARTFISGYLTLPNYANNLRSLGFGDRDLAGGGSDRLVDALIAHGDTATIAARIREHHQAGADHVAIQILTSGGGFPLRDYQNLAPAVLSP